MPGNITYDGVANFNAFLNKKLDREVPDIWFYPIWEDTYFRLPEMEMRAGNYTLIGWLPPKPDSMKLNYWFFKNGLVKYELNNLENDPGQQHNLVTEKPKIVNSLKGTMARLWKNIGMRAGIEIKLEIPD